MTTQHAHRRLPFLLILGLIAVPAARLLADQPVYVTNGAAGFVMESTDEVLAREALNPSVRSAPPLVPGNTANFAADKAAANAGLFLPGPSLINVPGLPDKRDGRLISFQNPGTCSCQPPDPILAVGPTHVLTGINNDIRVFNKSTGGAVWNAAWESFFSAVNPAGAGSFPSDPKLFYDSGSQRFFATVLMVNSARNKSWWMLAVSQTNSITSSTVWTKWAFDPTVAHASSFADYPGFGYDDSAIYISSNMFNTAGTVFLGVDMAVIPKAQLVQASPPPSPTFTQLVGITTSDSTTAFTLQPSHMYAAGNCFLASGSSGTSTKLYIYRVNTPTGSPTLTKTSVTVTSYSVPPDAPQRGTTALVPTNDQRLINAAWRNNKLWTAHTIANGSLAQARWYGVDTSAWPTATLSQSGNVNTNGASYYFPSVSVDSSDDVAIGFTRSIGGASGEFPSAWHCSRLVTDPVNTMGTPVLDHAGTAAYTSTRWGDYSGTTIDPSDNTTFWTLQEYATGSTSWSTWVTSFNVAAACTAPTVNAIANTNATCGVAFTSAAPSTSAGTPPFTWSLAAGTPAGMSVNTNTGVVSWPTPVTTGSPYSLTTIATNACGTNGQNWTLTVNANPPTVNPIANTNATCGVAFTSAAPSTSAGTPPFSWSLAAGAPAGMTMNTNSGVVSWPTPVTTGSPYTLTTIATNACGTNGQSWTLTVNANAPTINAISNAAVICGASYTGPTPTTTGGVAPFTWALTGSPPSGMTINPSTGVVSWPTAVSSVTPYTISIQASSSGGCGFGSRSWTLTVKRGDFTGDGLVTGADISGFVTDLLAVSHTCPGDVNGDTNVDGLDVQPFLVALGL